MTGRTQSTQLWRYFRVIFLDIWTDTLTVTSSMNIWDMMLTLCLEFTASDYPFGIFKLFLNSFWLSLRYSLTFICNLLVLIALYIFFNDLFVILMNCIFCKKKLIRHYQNCSYYGRYLLFVKLTTRIQNVSELCDLCWDNVKLYSL
jgi:hypothetical protein